MLGAPVTVDRHQAHWRLSSLVSKDHQRRRAIASGSYPPAMATYADRADTSCYGIRTKLAAGLQANFDSAPPVDLSLLPKPKRGGATGPEAVRQALPGDRNNTLNKQVFKAASRGTLDEPALP